MTEGTEVRVERISTKYGKYSDIPNFVQIAISFYEHRKQLICQQRNG